MKVKGHTYHLSNLYTKAILIVCFKGDTMETPFYEYIVVGLGGVGSGALYWLAKKAGNSEWQISSF